MAPSHALIAAIPVGLVLVHQCVLASIRLFARWAREKQALTLAPQVYRAGGDAADLVRSLGTAVDGNDVDPAPGRTGRR